jgi:hypothetical protein
MGEGSALRYSSRSDKTRKMVEIQEYFEEVELGRSIARGQ